MDRQYPVKIVEHTLIPLPDGTQLAARIWFPKTNSASADEQFPAVLEYLPYRKRDGTAPRDESTFPVFAKAGFVGIRVDISGHGESDGEFDDEYSPRELQHGFELINWISKQPWSNGSVGMMGISWGGFNGMQIAAMHPPALKAVISIGTTVDRYNDDIHYKNGCHLYSNFYWSNMMLTYAARCPDPLLRNDWEGQWKHRLEQQPFPLEAWLAHQRRDDFWKRGSVCEDYEGYTIPTLIMGGWADLYQNAPPELAAHAKGYVKAVNGPWIHKYPHFAWPKPRMDFHTEAINWWNHWLRGEQTYSADTPDYRFYVSENVRAGGLRLEEPGLWMAMDKWPDEQNEVVFNLKRNAQLAKAVEDKAEGSVSICSPVNCGISCGEMFSLSPQADLPTDQRIDDGGSLVFTADVIKDAVTLVGRPVFTVNVAIDKPLGNLCVRLLDVHPDGHSHRVSWGVVNLAHRNSNSNPEPMTPGKFETITLALDHCAYRFVEGHRIRLCISTHYWPAIHPPPEQVTASLQLGEHATLVLPLANKARAVVVPEPENDHLLPVYKQHTKSEEKRWVEKDIQNQQTRYCVFSDSGAEENPTHQMINRHIRDECWSIDDENPLSMKATGTHTWTSERDGWHTKIECKTDMTCDAEKFYLTARVTAWLDGQAFHEKVWERSVRRDFM